jgi:hypothetical protein
MCSASLIQMMDFCDLCETIVSLGPKHKGDGRADCQGPCLASEGLLLGLQGRNISSECTV